MVTPENFQTLRGDSGQVTQMTVHTGGWFPSGKELMRRDQHLEGVDQPLGISDNDIFQLVVWVVDEVSQLVVQHKERLQHWTCIGDKLMNKFQFLHFVLNCQCVPGESWALVQDVIKISPRFDPG